MYSSSEDCDPFKDSFSFSFYPFFLSEFNIVIAITTDYLSLLSVEFASIACMLIHSNDTKQNVYKVFY